MSAYKTNTLNKKHTHTQCVQHHPRTKTPTHPHPRTRTHNRHLPPPPQVPHAGAYTTTLTNASIILDPRQRRQHIWDGVQSLVAQVGGHCPAVASEGLLQEVTNLVEAPTVLLGSFEERFLALPRYVVCVGVVYMVYNYNMCVMFVMYTYSRICL